MRHYILIEVAHDHPNVAQSRIGIIRSAIHSVAGQMSAENGGNTASAVVREDIPYLYGSTGKAPYAEAQEVFYRAMGKEWTERRKARDQEKVKERLKEWVECGSSTWVSRQIFDDVRTLLEEGK